MEEPPEHVKFIFATTEIRKVPITVLSRCQRFDLRRIETDVLSDYYGEICTREEAKADEEALNLIARAADGSVRDGLSLLDQSIALGDGGVTVEQVKDMLGLADRALILDVMEAVLKGDSAKALEIMGDLYKKGADPVVVMQDMLEISHLLTKHRALPKSKDITVLPKGEQERLENLADALSMPTLARTWQILLKGLSEVNIAPNPQKAAEMVVIRLIYAADLPDPADLIKKLQSANANQTGGASIATGAPTSAPQVQAVSPQQPQADNTAPAGNVTALATQAAPQLQTNEQQTPPTSISTMQDVVNVLEQNGEMVFATQLRMFVHPVKIQKQSIELRLAENAPDRLSQDLSLKMKAATGKRWVVTVSNQQGEPTLAQLADKATDDLRAHAMEQPLVKNIMQLFPDAKLKEIKNKD